MPRSCCRRTAAAPGRASPPFRGGTVLVIDPGHGGADGGASAADGTLESGINLAVALRLRALAGLYGVETLMTRESGEIDYPEGADTLAEMKRADQRARLELINSTQEPCS